MKKQGPSGMNAVLRQRCTAIQKLLADVAVNEIGTRYEVGAIIRSVVETKGTYGDGAVELLAEALGRDAASLYRYAAVAKTWPEAEMRDISRRPNAHGEPLSWSHWVELARAPKTWRQWLELALLESWSVRRLAREIDAELGEKEDAEAEDTTCAALREAVKDAERLNGQMGSFGAVLDRLERSPRPAREVEELLARARQVFRDVARRSGDLLARVSEISSQEGPANGRSRRHELEN
jgi:hypothetical protein